MLVFMDKKLIMLLKNMSDFPFISYMLSEGGNMDIIVNQINTSLQCTYIDLGDKHKKQF